MNGENSLPADFRGIIEECAARALEEGVDGAPEWERFKVISDEVGKFLFILARSTWRSRMVDMGGRSGAASSVIWLAGAACQIDGEITAWESNPRRLLKMQNCLSRARLAPNVDLVSADPMWSMDDDEEDTADVATDEEQRQFDMVVASLIEPDWLARIEMGWDMLESDGLMILTDTMQVGEDGSRAMNEFIETRPAMAVGIGLGEGVLMALKLSDEAAGPLSESEILGEKAHDVLEKLREENRKPGTHLMAIPPMTGRFLWILARALGAKNVLEIGASAGYSGTWIAKGLEESDGKLTTVDIDPKKVRRAAETYEAAGVSDRVKVMEGDARDIVPTIEGTYDMVFLDCDKEYYQDLLEPILYRLRRGGLLVADNVISHGEMLKLYVEEVQHHPCLFSVTVPVGSGEEMTMVL
jgi:caffeoyl-CoA O-methyltransferase